MRNLVSSLILTVLISTQVFAGLPPTTLSGIGETAKPTTFTFRTPTNQATKVNGVESMIETGSSNILKNPGAEGGTTNWTASAGTFTATTTTAEILYDKKSFSWDSSAATQTVTSDAITIPIGLRGRNAVMSCLFAVQSGTATTTMSVYDGSTSTQTTTITSSATPTRTTINFPAASTGTVAIRLASVAANEPLILWDSCYLGPADTYNISQVNQANFIGSAYIGYNATCTNTVTSTSLVAFGTAAGCPAPVVESNPGPGVIQTTDADGPTFTVNALPPGVYRVEIDAPITTSSNVDGAIAINDGTTTGLSSYVDTNSSAVSSTQLAVGMFTYTSAGDRTFKLYGAIGSGTLTIYANAGSQKQSYRFRIYRYPSASEMAYRPDMLPASWSGYHANNCEWITTSTSYVDPTADASCTFTEVTNNNFGTVTSSGSTQPNINWTPKMIGSYYVCATLNKYTTSVDNYGWLKLTDGTTDIAERGAYGSMSSMALCGIYNIGTLAAKTLKIQLKTVGSSTTALTGNAVGRAIDWSIFYISQGVQTPTLVGSVTSGSTGAIKFEAGRIVCGTASSVTSQSMSSWISSVSNGTSGACTVNISSGTFTSAPWCVVSGSAGTARTCSLDGSPTSTTVGITCRNNNLNAQQDNSTADLMCMGPK